MASINILQNYLVFKDTHTLENDPLTTFNHENSIDWKQIYHFVEKNTELLAIDRRSDVTMCLKLLEKIYYLQHLNEFDQVYIYGSNRQLLSLVNTTKNIGRSAFINLDYLNQAIRDLMILNEYNSCKCNSWDFWNCKLSGHIIKYEKEYTIILMGITFGIVLLNFYNITKK